MTNWKEKAVKVVIFPVKLVFLFCWLRKVFVFGLVKLFAKLVVKND